MCDIIVKMKRKKQVLSVSVKIFVLIVVFFCGWYIHSSLNTSAVSGTKLIRENSTDYKLINPLLLAINVGSEKSPEYKKLTNNLTDYVNKKISDKKAENISIYFRDLNLGLWSGVDEDHMYSPASMMKVVILVESLRIAESDPSFLDKQVYVTPNSIGFNSIQSYQPKKSINAGDTYKVRDLISFMIDYSDNNATAVLYSLIGDDKLSTFLKELELPQPKSMDSDFLSPRLYSRFYRVLYNSTYLSPKVSEEALKILSQGDFPYGINSGIPKDIVVSQKFGERTVNDPLGNLIDRELHDCGIIYLPNKPYFLCVMTKGKDLSDLQSVLQDVSKTVWDDLSKR